jgi:NAD(P)-dependent dehydrogenase (short-subunit alcohol dehydrogenase family)
VHYGRARKEAEQVAEQIRASGGCQPDDIGEVIAFLATEDARWITGDTIRVDGGSKL